jgi:sugar phosphate isomerase/epimerase
MLKAVDREGFAVHLDPANLVNSPQRYYRNGDLLDECFDKLGDAIVSCHAKDVAWEVGMQVHFREVVLGAGALDYAVYLKRLAGLPHQPPLMVEHMQGAAEYDQCREHVLQLGKQIGVSF